MHDPFQLVVWAIAIGLAWMVLISLTGLDEWLKGLFGKKSSSDTDLEKRVETLERRAKELEQKKP